MATSISGQNRDCLQLFNTTLDSLNGTDRTALQLQVQEELDRYKVWAANLGAAFNGVYYKKSLDYRLREAPAYKEAITKLLIRVKGLLRQAIDFTDRIHQSQGTSPPESDAVGDDDGGGNDDQSPWELSSSDGDIEDLPSQANTQLHSARLPGSRAGDKLQLVVKSLSFTITSLYKMPVREPTSISRAQQLSRIYQIDFKSYEHFDMLFVIDLYPPQPRENDWLHRRLGQLITRRRELLATRRRRNEDLQRDAAESLSRSVSEHAAVTKHVSAEISHGTDEGTLTLTAKERSLKASTFRPGDAHPPPLYEITPSEAESVTSFASSHVEQDTILLPPRPMRDDGSPYEHFECPYCFTLIHIRSSHAWRKHVFIDLQPYVCTFLACDEPDRLFDNRETWYRHIMRHEMAFHCGDESHNLISSTSEFQHHMETIHGLARQSISSPSMLEMFARPSWESSRTCPLCRSQTENLKGHLSLHLQRIALFALFTISASLDTDQVPVSSDAAVRAEFQHDNQDRDDQSTHSVSSLRSSLHSFSDRDTIAATPRDEPISEQHSVPDADPVSWTLAKPELDSQRPAPQPQPSTLAAALPMTNLMKEFSLNIERGTLSLPKSYIKALKQAIQRILLGREVDVEYQSPLAKRVFAVFLNTLLEPSFSHRLEHGGTAEDMILVFFSNATKEMQKGKAPGESVQDEVIEPLVLFVRLLTRTLRDMNRTEDKQELASRLQRLEKNLLEHSRLTSDATPTESKKFLENVPPKTELAHALLDNQRRQAEWQFATARIGLTELVAAEDAIADVVFVHGLYGDPYKTWATTEPEVFWPAELLPHSLRHQPCRILTYGYDSEKMFITAGESEAKIHLQVLTLVDCLIANRRKHDGLERPLIFIAHSLGGILVKAILVHCSHSSRNPSSDSFMTFASTTAVIFFGTPHKGLGLDDRKSLLTSLYNTKSLERLPNDPSKDVSSLIRMGESISDINSSFKSIMDEFDIAYLYETKLTDLGTSTSIIIAQYSAAPLDHHGVARLPLARNHVNICKFATAGDRDYMAFVVLMLTRVEVSMDKVVNKLIEQIQNLDNMIEEAQTTERLQLEALLSARRELLRSNAILSEREDEHYMPYDQLEEAGTADLLLNHDDTSTWDRESSERELSQLRLRYIEWTERVEEEEQKSQSATARVLELEQARQKLQSSVARLRRDEKRANRAAND